MTSRVPFQSDGMLQLLKLAADDAVPGGTSTSPVPEIQIVSTTAHGKKGPVGTAPRANYSRVHTGSPPAPDAGATEQKTLPPKYGSTMSEHKTAMAARPTLQDMVKAAMVGALSQANVKAEAQRQFDNINKTASASEATPAAPEVTDGSSAVSTEYAIKCASALDYLAQNLTKIALVEPGKGPGALEVSQTSGTGEQPIGTAHSPNAPPMVPGTEKSVTGPSNAMATNMNDRPGGNAKTPQKTAEALFRANLERLGLKEASAGLYERNLTRLGLAKQADDGSGEGGAQVSAGAAVPPDTSATGEKNPSLPENASLVASSEAATNLTRGQAKAQPKREMGQWFDEPALSAAHDNTLQQVFSHTSEAGPKVASAKKAAAPLPGLMATGERGFIQKLLGQGAEHVHQAGDVAHNVLGNANKLEQAGAKWVGGPKEEAMKAILEKQIAESAKARSQDLHARLLAGGGAAAALGGAAGGGYALGRSQDQGVPQGGMTQLASVKTAASRAILEKLMEEQKLNAPGA